MFDFTSHRCDLFFLGAGGATRSSQHWHFSSLVDCLLLTHSAHEQTVQLKKMLAPFLFFFTNLNTMHMLHDVRLLSVTCVRFFFSLSTILTHDNTHTNNTKGAPRTKPGTHWFLGNWEKTRQMDTLFGCPKHVLARSLCAWDVSALQLVWRPRAPHASCAARHTKGGDGSAAASWLARAARGGPGGAPSSGVSFGLRRGRVVRPAMPPCAVPAAGGAARRRKSMFCGGNSLVVLGDFGPNFVRLSMM